MFLMSQTIIGTVMLMKIQCHPFVGRNHEIAQTKNCVRSATVWATLQPFSKKAKFAEGQSLQELKLPVGLHLFLMF